MDENKTKTSAIIAAFSIALMVTGTTGISLILADLSAAFPAASTAAVQFVFTLSRGAGLVGSISVGMLSGKLTKKNIALLLLMIGVAGGLLGLLGYGTLALLYISSFLIGVSLGGLNPVGPAIIGEYAAAERRASLNGLYSIVLSLGGMVTTILAGKLAANGWNRVYLLYMLLVPIFFLCLFCIPHNGVIENSKGEEGKGETGGKFLNRQVLQLYIVAVFVAVTWVVYNSNVSYLLEGNTAMSGYVTVVFMGGMFIAGFMVNTFRKLFKGRSIPAAVGMCALSLWVLSVSEGNVVLLCIGAALLGVGYCAYTALSYAKLPEIATPGTMTRAMSFFAAIASGGALLHPYLVTVPAAALSDSVSMRFTVSAVILTVGTVIAFLPNGMQKSREESSKHT